MRRRATWPGAAIALLGILGPLTSGCGAPSGESVHRLIAEDPELILSAAALAESVPVLEWTFRSAEDLEPWTCHQLDLSCEVRGGRLVLQSSSEDPQLIRSVDFDSSAVKALEVETVRPVRLPMQVFWAGPGERFSSERRADLRPLEGVGRERTQVAALAAHPGWKGRIAALRLDPMSQPEAVVEVSRIAAVERVVRARDLGSVAEKSWKFDLDSEVRNARLGLPGHSLSWEIRLPRRGRLSFSLGVLSGVDLETAAVTEAGKSEVAPRFRVRLRPKRGDSQVLFEETLDAAPAAPARWADREVDLAEFAGQSVALSLEVEAPAGGTLAGVPIWGNPEVVGRRRGEAPPNVVLISVDTLRADRLSLNGYPRPTSPHIDAWAKTRGVSFSAAVAQAPWTLPSHVSMFTGLEPLRHGVNYSGAAPGELDLLAELLRGAGYTTVALTGGVYMRPEWGFTQGFDVFRYWPSQIDAEDELEQGVERAGEWLERLRARPFFLFFHTYEVHGPYLAREPYYSQFGGPSLSDPAAQLVVRPEGPAAETGYRRVKRIWWRQERDAALAPLPESMYPVLASLYDSGVAYADELLGRLLERLETLDLARRTIVVLTSDHGESLGEQGRVEHYHNYDDNLRVPLVLSYPPALPAGRVIDRQVRSVDIVPTVLELAGLAVPDGLDGVSLLPVIERERDLDFPDQAVSYAASSNHGLALRIGNRLKYVYNNAPLVPAADREELYLLDSAAGESVNRISERRSEAAALRRRALALLDRGPGLRIGLENASEGTIRGALGTRALNSRLVVKAYELPCDCVEWVDERLRFEVPPGLSYTLNVEEVDVDRLHLEGSWWGKRGEDRYDFDWSIDPVGLAEAARLDFEPPEWVAHSGTGEGSGTRISVWWEGAARSSAAAPASEKLRRELEALGYLQGGD